MKSNFIYGALCSVALLAVSANAQFVGTAKLIEGGAGQTASLSTFNTATSDGGYTFNIGSLSSVNYYISGGAGSTTGANFLAFGGTSVATFTGTTGMPGVTSNASTVAMSGGTNNTSGCGGNLCWSTMIDIKGTLAAGTYSFSVTHDDGAAVYLNNVSIGGKASPTTAFTDDYSFTLATATTFDLVYDACCKAPEVLKVSNFSATPEPGSIALLATTLIGAGLVYRRRRTNV